MNFIRAVFLKLGVGVLYGAGFAFGLMAAGAIFTESNSLFREESEEWKAPRIVKYDETAQLISTIRTERIADGEFTLLGEIENRGLESWSMINIKAELFDENGNFLDQCEDYISGTSSPGSVIKFKMSCGSDCSSIALEKFAEYKIEIVDAHHRG